LNNQQTGEDPLKPRQL